MPEAHLQGPLKLGHVVWQCMRPGIDCRSRLHRGSFIQSMAEYLHHAQLKLLFWERMIALTIGEFRRKEVGRAGLVCSVQLIEVEGSEFWTQNCEPLPGCYQAVALCRRQTDGQGHLSGLMHGLELA